MRFEDLSPEQQEFINEACKGKNILVDACIGSGKTTTIQTLCQYLNNKSVLYLTYNKLLKLDAKEKIKFRNVQVTNYNGFAWWCLNNIGVRCGISDQFQTFNRYMPRIPKKYNVLIIDEYQDIEYEMVGLLNHIKVSNPGIQIIAVGDMDQKIYDKTALDVPQFMDGFLGTYEKMNFTRCFRLSKDIAARYGAIWNKPIIGVNKDCKVETLHVDEVEELLKKCHPSEVLCLGARMGQMANTLNRLEKECPNIYNKKTVYASISDNDRQVEPDKNVAIFTTFDSSKGMERPICVVFDFTEDYWGIRANKPMTDQKILRNIFCVAGSRGKNRIIFVKDNESKASEKKEMLSDETLMTIGDKNKTFAQPFQASSMFDFKFKEDVEECYKLLKVEKVEVPHDKGEVFLDNIEVNMRDEMIDLAPCIGIYQEAMFFDNYDIDKDIKLAAEIRDVSVRYKSNDPDLNEKILMLAALETGYDRYNKQANNNFINKPQAQQIYDRLFQIFNGREAVQKDCSVTVQVGSGEESIDFNGRIDVDKNNEIYELKFTQELTHEHFLQLAFYLIAKDRKYGYLWNIRTNDLYKVYAPDEQEFMNKVVWTVTKHVYKECAIYEKNDEMINMDRFKKKNQKKRGRRAV